MQRAQNSYVFVDSESSAFGIVNFFNEFPSTTSLPHLSQKYFVAIRILP